MVSNFAGIAKLLRDVGDGSMATAEFARTLKGRADDAEWLQALGMALRQLTALMEGDAGAKAALERQQTLAAQSTALAVERLEVLERVTAERDGAQREAARLDKECAKLTEQVDFLSMFSTPPGAEPDGTPKKGGGGGGKFAAIVKAARDREAASKRRGGAAPAGQGGAVRTPRHVRMEHVHLHSEAQRRHRKEQEAKYALLVDAHAAELRRLEERRHEERRVHVSEVETREEVGMERRRKEEARLAEMAEEAERCRMREGSALARAAAASEVLSEVQAELRALRGELSRTQLALRKEEAHVQTARLQAEAAGQVAEQAEARAAAATEAATEERRRREISETMTGAAMQHAQQAEQAHRHGAALSAQHQQRRMMLHHQQQHQPPQPQQTKGALGMAAPLTPRPMRHGGAGLVPAAPAPPPSTPDVGTATKQTHGGRPRSSTDEHLELTASRLAPAAAAKTPVAGASYARCAYSCG
jgi:hypothetical protein